MPLTSKRQDPLGRIGPEIETRKDPMGRIGPDDTLADPLSDTLTDPLGSQAATGSSSGGLTSDPAAPPKMTADSVINQVDPEHAFEHDRDLLEFYLDFMRSPSTTVELAKAAVALKKSSMKVESQFNGLTVAEIMAIRAYSLDSPLYREVNKALRTKDVEKISGFQKYVDTVDSGLDKLPNLKSTKKKRQLMYRGCPLTDAQIAKYSAGSTFVDPQFTSASKQISVAQRFAMPSGDNSEGRKANMFIIKPRTASSIAGISALPAEDEAVFKSHTEFKVISNTPATAETPFNVIVLSEVAKT
jgi:hypothetical protein